MAAAKSCASRSQAVAKWCAPALARLGLPTDPARAIPELLATVGRAAAHHLLLVDDVPRLDDISAAAVYQLVRAFGVPTLATARLGETLPGPAARLVNEGLTDRHELAGLRVDQVDQLLETRYAARARYADVVRVDDVAAPADLADAMADRLAALATDERRLLRLAALLQPVDRAVLGADADQAAMVARLESAGLLVPEQGTAYLRISHPLVTETLQREAASGPEVEEAIRRLRRLDTPRDRLLAARLGVSVRTVDTQLQSVYRKLGVAATGRVIGGGRLAPRRASVSLDAPRASGHRGAAERPAPGCGYGRRAARGRATPGHP
jgi:hypothetical protein